MKKTVLIATVLFALVSSAFGVVGHNDTGGDMGVTSSGGSAGATTSVGPNGTEYSGKVSMEGRTQENTTDRIREESISSSGVKFNGTIRAETQCHVIEHEINKVEDGHVMNIKTVKGDENGSCTQAINGINYNAEFEEEVGVTLEVQHNGEEIKTYDTVSDKGGKNKGENRSIIQVIMEFLGL